MKKLIVAMLAILLGVIFITSCEDDKTYNGPAQIAFINKTAAYTVDKDMTIAIPVQLIADGPQGDISGNITVGAISNCAAAVTVPPTVTIPAGRYAGELSVNVTYSKLAAGNANKLVLDLKSPTVNVAANYDTLTVTITKK